MALLAGRAATGPVPPFATGEGEAAGKTGERTDDQLHALAAEAPFNVLQVAVDLFFHDAQDLGEFHGIAFLLLEQGDDLLPDRQHGLPSEPMPQNN